MATYTVTVTVTDDAPRARLPWVAVLTDETGNTAHSTGGTAAAAILAVLHTTAAHTILGN